MEIIFLGTSSGTPTKSRNVSAIAIKKRNQKAWCLVDCGEGTQHQILHTSLALNHLSAVMITHVHGDHCYGLPGLLASAAMAGRKEPMVVVAPAAIKTLIETTQKLSDTYLTYEITFIDVESMDDSMDDIHGCERFYAVSAQAISSCTFFCLWLQRAKHRESLGH